MGLSASQGRLLSLTSRRNDLERRSQSISNQKMRLTAASTAASNAYQEALSREQISFNNGYNTVEANVINMTEYNPDLTTQRFLKTADGRTVVTSEVANVFNSGISCDEFLYKMGLATQSLDSLATQYAGSMNFQSLMAKNNVGATFAASANQLLMQGSTGDFQSLTTLANQLYGIGSKSATELAGQVTLYKYEQQCIIHDTTIASLVLGLNTGTIVQADALNEKASTGISASSIELYHTFSSMMSSYGTDTSSNAAHRVAYEKELQTLADALARYFGVDINDTDAKDENGQYVLDSNGNRVPSSNSFRYQVLADDPKAAIKNSLTVTDTSGRDDGNMTESDTYNLDTNKLNSQLVVEKYLTTGNAGVSSNGIYQKLCSYYKIAMGAAFTAEMQNQLKQSILDTMKSYLSQAAASISTSSKTNMSGGAVKDLLTFEKDLVGVGIDDSSLHHMTAVGSYSKCSNHSGYAPLSDAVRKYYLGEWSRAQLRTWMEANAGYYDGNSGGVDAAIQRIDDHKDQIMQTRFVQTNYVDHIQDAGEAVGPSILNGKHVYYTTVYKQEKRYVEAKSLNAIFNNLKFDYSMAVAGGGKQDVKDNNNNYSAIYGAPAIAGGSEHYSGAYYDNLGLINSTEGGEYFHISQTQALKNILYGFEKSAFGGSASYYNQVTVSTKAKDATGAEHDAQVYQDENGNLFAMVYDNTSGIYVPYPVKKKGSSYEQQQLGEGEFLGAYNKQGDGSMKGANGTLTPYMVDDYSKVTRMSKNELLALIKKNIEKEFSAYKGDATDKIVDLDETVRKLVTDFRDKDYAQYMSNSNGNRVNNALSQLEAILDGGEFTRGSVTKDYSSNPGVSANITTVLGLLTTLNELADENNFTNMKRDLKFDKGMVTYYTNLYNEMKSGGCVAMTKQMKSSEWLATNLASGNIYLATKDDIEKVGELAVRRNYKTDDPCISTASNNAYIAKAEAEYEATLNEIDAKEKRLDIELENNNTEYSAIQEEISSVEKVMEKNIGSTFKLFS